MGPGSKGTISVQELLHPLGGKGLRAIQKAEALLAKGESVKAMESLRAAMRYPDAEPHALGLLGTEHLKKGDLDTAILELEHAVQMLPSTAAFQSNLALALALRGRNEEGLIVARKALKLNPGAAKTRYVMAHLLLRMGYRDEAEFHLKMAAAEFPAARMTLNQYFSK
jgi:tetratricopeptide (TPR) repeat protein